jgi:hypothetical protein
MINAHKEFYQEKYMGRDHLKQPGANGTIIRKM